MNSYQNILVNYNYTILIIGLDITFRYDILKVEIAEVLKRRLIMYSIDTGDRVVFGGKKYWVSWVGFTFPTTWYI